MRHNAICIAALLALALPNFSIAAEIEEVTGTGASQTDARSNATDKITNKGYTTWTETSVSYSVDGKTVTCTIKFYGRKG